jgi:hypothetical protein
MPPGKSEYKSTQKKSAMPEPDEKPEYKSRFGPDSTFGKALLLAAAALMIAILAVVAYSVLQKQAPAVIIVPNLTDIKNLTTPCSDDNCFFESAIKQNDSAVCEHILDAGRLEECYERFAGFSIDVCLKLTNYREKTICVEKHAVKSGGISLCENLKINESNECIAKVEPCYFRPKEEISLCKALNANDYALCYDDQSCIYSYAKEKNSAEACAVLSDNVTRAVCASVVSREDKCDELMHSKVDQCRELYAEETNDLYLCYDIAHDSVYELQCFAHFASFTGNFKLCDNVGLINRWACYENYSLSTMDITGCAQISNFTTFSKIRCYVDFSREFARPDVCEAMNEFTKADAQADAKAQCYAVGILNNTKLMAEGCRGVESENWKLRCYTNVALLTNSTAICNELNATVDRDYCITNGQQK